jgi:hypothetical protein
LQIGQITENNEEEWEMKVLTYLVAALLLIVPATLAGAANDKEKDEDRIENAGTVMDEILNVPDNIP